MANTDKTFDVTESNTLLPFLQSVFPTTGRNKVKSLLTNRRVRVENTVVTRHDHLLQPGQKVTVTASSGSSYNEPVFMRGVRILFEDDALLVVDKPPGLLTIATEDEKEKTAYHVLTDYVRRTNPRNRIFIVHRLDRDTSGVMMFAKTEEVKLALQENWKEAVLERKYLALVQGRVETPEGVVHTWLQENKAKNMFVSQPGDGVEAITHYQVMKASNEFSLLSVWLDTGRKNQIRAHMQHIGHPIVGDKRYGSTKDILGRLGLHAHVLSFTHPVTKKQLRFETPIPPRFASALNAKPRKK